jgi:hypothetical protein
MRPRKRPTDTAEIEAPPLAALTPAQEAKRTAVTLYRAALQAALVDAGGVVQKAAPVVGKSYDQVRRDIRKLGLLEWLDRTYPKGDRQPTKGAHTRQPGSGRRATKKSSDGS